MENIKRCDNCDRELEVGMDTITVEEGVIGMKRFIPLGKILFFCCERCLRDYFDMDDLSSVPQRIP